MIAAAAMPTAANATIQARAIPSRWARVTTPANETRANRGARGLQA